MASLVLATKSIALSESRQTSDQIAGIPEDVTLAVSDRDGNHIGSAVSIQIEGGYHWAVTNRHVTGNLNSVCLSSRTGKVYPFNVITASSSKAQKEKLDITFLWAPLAITQELPVAIWEEQQETPGETLRIVEATGFPSSLSNPKDKPQLLKLKGLQVQLLDGELEEGFDTTYTAAVQKGMSGGGVFANNKLIAINGAHSDPLWPVEWRSRLGKPVEEALNMKLALVSIGISTRVISRELKNAQVESTKTRNDSHPSKCGNNN